MQPVLVECVNYTARRRLALQNSTLQRELTRSTRRTAADGSTGTRLDVCA